MVETDPVAAVAVQSLPEEHGLDRLLERLRGVLEEDEELLVLAAAAPLWTLGKQSLLGVTTRRLICIGRGFPASEKLIPFLSLAFAESEQEALVVIADGARTRFDGVQPKGRAAEIARMIAGRAGIALGAFRELPELDAQVRFGNFTAWKLSRDLPEKVKVPEALSDDGPFRHLAAARWRGRRGFLGATDRHLFFLPESGKPLVLDHHELGFAVRTRSFLLGEQLICSSDRRHHFRRVRPREEADAIMAFVARKAKLDPVTSVRAERPRADMLRDLAWLQLERVPRELEALDEHLPPGERVIHLTAAELDEHRGVVAVTESQVVFVRSKKRETPVIRAFRLDQLRAVHAREGKLAGSLTLDAEADNAVRFRLVDPKEQALEIAKYLGVQIDGRDERGENGHRRA
jgi:hypothetical protein